MAAPVYVWTGCTSPMISLTIKSVYDAEPSSLHLLLLRSPDSIKPGLLPPRSGRVEYLQTDLSDISSVRKTAETIVEHVQTCLLPKIASIVLGGAVQVVKDGPKVVKDGEITIVTCYLAHFQLVSTLLPVLTAEAKNSHANDWAYFKKRFDYRPLNTFLHPAPDTRDTHDDGMLRYATAKAYQSMHAHELARRLARSSHYSGMKILLWEPGSMPTNLVRDWPWHLRTLYGFVLNWPRIINRFDPVVNASAAANSASTLTRILTDPRFLKLQPRTGGAPYIGAYGQERETTGQVNDEKLAAELWADTVGVLGLQNSL